MMKWKFWCTLVIIVNVLLGFIMHGCTFSASLFTSHWLNHTLYFFSSIFFSEDSFISSVFMDYIVLQSCSPFCSCFFYFKCINLIWLYLIILMPFSLRFLLNPWCPLFTTFFTTLLQFIAPFLVSSFGWYISQFAFGILISYCCFCPTIFTPNSVLVFS